MPAHEAIGYVLGACLVFVVLLVAYGSIMASRTARVRRELASLSRAREDGKR
jgi:cytochrome b